MKNIIIVANIILLILLAGCQTPEPYDYAKLNESRPRSILIIPPLNESVEVNAPYTFLSTISKPLAEKGYYVYPVAVIDLLFKENGLPTPAEMNAIPIDKLREQTGADTVLYVTIDDWGQTYRVLASVTKVSSTAKLVDTRTGETLWDTEMVFEQSSDDGGGGLIGALVGAVVTQIAGSLVDKTPGVSSIANNLAINNKVNGLLPGPYMPAEAVN